MLILRWNLLSLLFLLSIVESTYKKYDKYEEHIQKWIQMVPPSQIHNASHFSNRRQMCGKSPCQFYYFQHINPNYKSNKTMLLVSGMHGNEYLGPHALLYAYKELDAARIIYFPIANPSGFSAHSRYGYPVQVAPNRDYPVDKNKACYTAVSTKIIYSIFQTYSIDLVVAIHNGGNQIGFNWGTVSQSRRSHTEEYDIYMDIGKMMRYFGGSNSKLGMPSFKLGTMTEVVYPAQGTFDDWAYVVNRFPKMLSKCVAKAPQVTPDKAHSLVYLIEMGDKNIPQKYFGSEQGLLSEPTSIDSSNGYLSRVIRILHKLTHVLEPQLKVHFKMNEQKKTYSQIMLTVAGCKTIQKIQIKIRDHDKKIQLVSYSAVNLKAEQIDFYVKEKIDLENENLSITKQSTIEIIGQYQCDASWIGKGTSPFSQPRIYLIKQTIKLAIYNQEQKLTTQHKYLKQQLNQFNQESSEIVKVAMVIVVLLIIVVFAKTIIKTCAYLKEKIKKRKHGERFQRVERLNQRNEKLDINPDLDEEAEPEIETDRAVLAKM